MDEAALTDRLAGSLEDTRAARDALVEQGVGVVAPVLDVLCDEESPVEWTVSGDVLCRIGEPALLPLAEAAASARAARSPEVARRIAWATARLEVDDPGVYVPLLKHPHATVRELALSVLRHQDKAAPRRFADPAVPLLGDPAPEVRRQAVLLFEAMGAETAVPLLRRIRRRPAPAPGIRAGALEALAAVAGPAVLDRRDLAAWRRLTRIKRRTEIPEGMHVCGSWYAVPSTDQDAVLDAFGLADPEPVTLRTGAAAWNQDHHGWHRTRTHHKCARVFVSPALDGWTLVFGESSEDTHRIGDADDPEKAQGPVVRRRCADLGRRFGAAQWYGMSCGDGWTAWCIAEGGEVVRHYDVFEAGEREGERQGERGRSRPVGAGAPAHPAEAGYLLPHLDGFPDGAFDGVDLMDFEAYLARRRQVMDEFGIPETCHATDIAARLSVDPGSLGPHTRVTGSGVLALTACGREHGHPEGALPC
ncbi:hypothetical protein SLINC_3793 [Streptomyces lincolnensis]|uniref:Uncharacterized protein n=1 Tax=Streptomyces lincolnensis TaxID=1915 RepID=A0A1B1MBZ9_STRLN|nr:HEAT repeat domain-containing protein [Streptomyces lincolnensis]ANS66017.1 hypothetical protein SLINC_3793 [Streptomyces lincolnensis]AXG54219.1 hypothetical protein SLCG_3064 [Streptomyces lincolnensis]QMV08598.1 hypothetical protein GJU35_25120 [Streptomyces lincolnensis]